MLRDATARARWAFPGARPCVAAPRFTAVASRSSRAVIACRDRWRHRVAAVLPAGCHAMLLPPLPSCTASRSLVHPRPHTALAPPPRTHTHPPAQIAHNQLKSLPFNPRMTSPALKRLTLHGNQLAAEFMKLAIDEEPAAGAGAGAADDAPSPSPQLLELRGARGGRVVGWNGGTRRWRGTRRGAGLGGSGAGRGCSRRGDGDGGRGGGGTGR